MRAFLCPLTGLVFMATAFAGKAPFPSICGVKGKVEIHGAEGKELKANIKQTLYEKARIRTEKDSAICLELSSSDRLVVGEASEVEIPFIDFDQGLVNFIRLAAGEFLLLSKTGTPRTVASDLFRVEVQKGDYVFQFDRGTKSVPPAPPQTEAAPSAPPQKPSGTLTVIEGGVSFKGLETEVSAEVVSGQAATFEGEALDGEIQYDVLLKGKKVARGKLLPVKTLTSEELKTLNHRFSWQAVKGKIGKSVGGEVQVGGRTNSAAKRKTMNKGKGKTETKTKTKTESETESETETKTKIEDDPSRTAPTSLAICHNPQGQFNQCAWVCEHNPKSAKTCLLNHPKVTCVRSRCNASGEWADRFVYRTERAPCMAESTVKECDY
ncbi:MAG: hypothetical protein C5B49_09395 [Bdellovibrio sp.]|nr:MAG: hypothetical protein C5B49_09395 [Bdellovibrio sp.]